MSRLTGSVLVLFLVLAHGVLDHSVLTHDASAAVFQGLDPMSGGPDSFANDVSGDGSTVVGTGTPSFWYEAFRWKPANESNPFEEFLGLSSLPSTNPFSTAESVSFDGSVVVGGSSLDLAPPAESATQAFRWTVEQGMAGLGMVGLGDLPGGEFYSKAFGVSDDGLTVVGESHSSSGLQAFYWTPLVETAPDEFTGGMVLLAPPADGLFSRALAISGDGSTVVGERFSGGHEEAFRWTAEEGMVGVGYLNDGELGHEDLQSKAWNISGDGSTVVGWSYSGEQKEAFRWTQEDGMVGLGSLPGGGDSEAFAVSADGSVVVGTANSGSEAFIWDAGHGMRNLSDVLTDKYGLDLTGWTLSDARGISADGLTMVGSSVDAQLGRRAWQAVIEKLPLTSIASGDFNDASTWDDGALIPSTDLETIVGDDHTVTVAGNGNASSLLIDGLAAAVTIEPLATLDVANVVQLAGGTLGVASTGKLVVGGDFTMDADSTLSVTLGPSSDMLDPLIEASGEVILGSDTLLTVTAAGSLGDLSAGEWGERTQTIFAAGSGVAGSFFSHPLPNQFLGHGVFYEDTIYDNETGTVQLKVFQAAPGDANGDRQVNFDDIVALLASGLWNVSNPDPPAVWTQADFTGDGLVGFDDIVAMLASGLWNKGPYDNPAPAGKLGTDYAAATVPEPGTTALLAVGVLGLLAWRRRRNR